MNKKAERYTLKVQYVGWMQVTRNIPRELLESEEHRQRLFRACGRWTAAPTYGSERFKLTSGLFFSESLQPLPSNPLAWPDGFACERRIGPWHCSDFDLGYHLDAIGGLSFPVERAKEEHAAGRITAEEVDTVARYMFSEWICHNLMERGSWRDGLEIREVCKKDSSGACAGVDWPATFDLDGVNGDLLEIFDTAVWEVYPTRPGPLSLPVNEPGRDYSVGGTFQTAVWEFGGGETARLYFKDGDLLEGCLLRHQKGSVETVTVFETAFEALAFLELSASTDRALSGGRGLIETVTAPDGEYDGSLRVRLADSCERVTICSL